MTAKKKQKQKKMMLKRGVSVSSSSSDDDDENAVKDEKNIERRKEKNIERRKEKIGSEMWELTRAYKKREESVERWLSANKNNASMEGRGGECMWMYHAARALNRRDGKLRSWMPRNVKMDLDKAIEHRKKASQLVFKYAKATGEALDLPTPSLLEGFDERKDDLRRGGRGGGEDYECSYAWVQNRRGGGGRRRRGGNGGRFHLG